MKYSLGIIVKNVLKVPGVEKIGRNYVKPLTGVGFPRLGYYALRVVRAFGWRLGVAERRFGVQAV